MHDYLAAEQYKDALTLYRRDTSSWIIQRQEEREARLLDAEDPERRVEELQENRAASRVLASAARQGLGQNRFPGALRSGLDKQLDRCTLGTRMNNSPRGQALIRAGFHAPGLFLNKSWEERLGWTYLLGRFFTGQTDAREIVRSWRSETIVTA